MSQKILKQEIIALSYSDNWDEAVKEWELDTIYEAEEFKTCLCTHYPIREICVLFNHKLKAHTEVGNCCVKKFMGLPSEELFRSVRNITKDVTKSISWDLLFFAKRKNWISQWEYGFYHDIRDKRRLSEKQDAIKERINQKILNNIKHSQTRRVLEHSSLAHPALHEALSPLPPS